MNATHLGIAAITLCAAACSDKVSTGATAHHASASVAATQRPEPSSRVSAAPTVSAAPSAAPDDGRTVSISVEQLVQHDGTAMGISFPHPDGWVGGTFSDDDVAWSSSPPGDSSMMRVWSYKKATHDFAALKALVQAKNPKHPIGTEDKLSLAGETRVAMSSRHGSGLASSATCTVMIPGPVGSAFGLVVELTSSWGDDAKQATCAEITASRNLAKIVRQLRVDISGSD